MFHVKIPQKSGFSAVQRVLRAGLVEHLLARTPGTPSFASSLASIPFPHMFLDIDETYRRQGRFDAFVDGELIVARSRQPFLDGARALLARGVDPATMLIMRHYGTKTESLKATVGAAAKVRVKEENAGGRPRFVPYDADPMSSRDEAE